MKLFVTGTRGIPYVMGGVETHCEELFPRIAKHGVNVTVIRRQSYVNDKLQEWKGVQLIDVETPKKKSFEAIIHTFRAINKAKRMGADVLHVHAIGPALLVPYAKLLGMKVVFTHHGPDYDRDKWGKVAKMILKLGERMGCMFADDVIVISDVIRNLIKQKYGRPQKVHLIYNGVPEPETCDYPEYFEELGIEKGKYILGMCRFVPEKRLHDLVDAYARLRKEQKIPSDIRLVLAGDTDFEDEYSQTLKRNALNNNIVLTGFIKGRKLHSLLTHARCYSLPSSHEGLPISLLEAMSYRLPVVVSNIPANKEIGLQQECYFHCGDVGELATRLEHVIKQPQRPINYDMKKYDWDIIATQVMDIYAAFDKKVSFSKGSRAAH